MIELKYSELVKLVSGLFSVCLPWWLRLLLEVIYLFQTPISIVSNLLNIHEKLGKLKERKEVNLAM